VLRFASGFFPTRPRGARQRVSRRAVLRAVAFSSRLLPTRSVEDLHLQSSAHAGHTYASIGTTAIYTHLTEPTRAGLKTILDKLMDGL